MRHPLLSALLSFSAACSVALHAAPPQTRASDFSETLHGVVQKDPYRWLEDQNSPETRAWIDSQNNYTRSFLDKLPSREKISARLTELLKIDRETLPIERGGRYFFSRRTADQEQSVLFMREGLHGQDQVVYDPNAKAGAKTSSAAFMGFSDDGKAILYGIRQGGEDELTPVLYDPVKKSVMEDQLPKGRYNGISFLPDNKGFYYSKRTEKGSRIFLHLMGTATDEELFGKEYGLQNFISTQISEDGHYVLFTVGYGSSGSKSDLFLMTRDAKNGNQIKPLVNDVQARFTGEFGGGHLFLRTDWKAPNGRILMVDLRKPERANWHEVVAETANPMQSFTLAGEKICVEYLENVKPLIRVFEPGGKAVRDITVPSLGSVGALEGRWKSDDLFYSFQSFAQPPSSFRYSLRTGQQEAWVTPRSPVNPADFEVKQVWYTSKDKTRVPMFLFSKKGVVPDGNRPVWLTGYGGFTLSQLPTYNAAEIAWAEQGGVLALPNLRGGAEFGEKWHQAAMYEHKQNVFDDFISAAEWLIANKYTNSQKLAISGTSNGGLLVGAALTERPDLFRAVQCGFPLLDMVRFHRFMLGPLWVSEYGSSEDAKQFAYISKYSPYQNVHKGTKYPAVLLVTGDADTRVAPLHARKMTALLQASTGSDLPILLRYNTKAGHSGGQPISQQVEDFTDTLSFFADELGMQWSN